MMLRSIHHVFKFKECHHPDPTPPHPTPAVAQHPPCVQVQRMSSSPAHPTPPQHLRSIHHVCVASTMCSSSKNVIIPSPPHPTPPQQLRSIHHVCVASTMCSSSKNVIIPTPPHPTPAVAQHPPCVQVQRMSSSRPHPTPPQQLRSIHHVFKSKECHHPQPTPPHPSSCVASTMCA